MRLGPLNSRVAVIMPCLNEAIPIAGVVREILAEGVGRFSQTIGVPHDLRDEAVIL